MCSEWGVEMIITTEGTFTQRIKKNINAVSFQRAIK